MHVHLCAYVCIINKRQRAIFLLGSITRSELGKQNKHTSLGLTAGLKQAKKVYKVHRQQKHFLPCLMKTFSIKGISKLLRVNQYSQCDYIVSYGVSEEGKEHIKVVFDKIIHKTHCISVAADHKMHAHVLQLIRV